MAKTDLGWSHQHYRRLNDISQYQTVSQVRYSLVMCVFCKNTPPDYCPDCVIASLTYCVIVDCVR